MKTKITLTLLTALLIILSIQSNQLSANSRGSIGGFSSSAGNSGNSCGQVGCHGGGHTIQNGILSTNIPASGYTPGMTYRINVSGNSGTGVKFGFELAAENSSNSSVGNLSPASAGSREKILSNGNATHTSAGNTGASGNFAWQLDWTAPSAGTGNVRFSASILVADNNGTNSGDMVIIDSTTVSESSTTSISKINSDNTKLYPNPMENKLNIYSKISSLNKLIILNMKGKIVVETSIESVDQIDVSQLTKGVYFVVVSNNYTRFTEKIIKL